jgi:hypothetical protein
MTKHIAIIILLFLATYDGVAGPPADKLRGFERQRLIETAKVALERGRLPLPRTYEVEVSDGQAITELTPVRPLYVVTFKFIRRGKKDIIYTVHINKRSRKVEDVYDSRSSVPSRVF